MTMSDRQMRWFDSMASERQHKEHIHFIHYHFMEEKINTERKYH